MIDKSKGQWIHESKRNIKRISAWSINVVWEDGTEEVLTNMPDYVATEVDAWLTRVEEDNSPEEEEGDDTYDAFGVNTKNSFNTPPKE